MMWRLHWQQKVRQCKWQCRNLTEGSLNLMPEAQVVEKASAQIADLMFRTWSECSKQGLGACLWNLWLCIAVLCFLLHNSVYSSNQYSNWTSTHQYVRSECCQFLLLTFWLIRHSFCNCFWIKMSVSLSGEAKCTAAVWTAICDLIQSESG